VQRVRAGDEHDAGRRPRTVPVKYDASGGGRRRGPPSHTRCVVGRNGVARSRAWRGGPRRAERLDRRAVRPERAERRPDEREARERSTRERGDRLSRRAREERLSAAAFAMPSTMASAKARETGGRVVSTAA
jgi:hypothetical protein